MGRPNGSRNISNTPWADALRLAVHAGSSKKDLRRIADKCVEKALNGDLNAIKEIGDRLDGKAPQGLVLSGDKDNPVGIKVGWDTNKG